jgi:phenylpropionate dioxygenase-like ring-hydroxylating dioxygenase large terminal subunit
MKPEQVIRWFLFLAPLVQGFGVQSSIRQEIKASIQRGRISLFSSNDLIHDLNESVEGVVNIAIGAWAPVGSVSCLSGLDPTCLELFGHRLVVWQKSPTHWSVMMDECPHRFAPLSQGRVDPITKCIECPYHGWQFHDNGTLACIPQLEQDKEIPQRMSAEAFPTHVVGDLIFAFLPSYMHGESFPIHLLPEDYYQDLTEFVTPPQVTFYTRDLPYSWDFLVENLMDGPAHLAYAHNTIGSKREDAAPIPMKVRVSNFTHFDYQSSYIRQGEERYRRFGFQRPFLTHQETPRGPGGEWKRTLLFFCVPVREGSCRIITNFYTLVRATHPDAPDWKVHLTNNR